MIGHLLDDKTAEVGGEAVDWEEAVRKCGLILERQGLASSGYTDAMVEAVRKFGPYMVVAPGVALAHARPEDGVKSRGLSLAKLSTPVNFGHESNDPVSLVFGLAATRSDDHVNLIAELASFLSERLEDLKVASTVDEILHLVEGRAG